MKTSNCEKIKLLVVVTVLLFLPWAFAQPIIRTEPKDTSVSLGGTAQFTVYATSTNSTVTYKWWFKDAALDAVANPSVATRFLSISNVTLANEGPYFVVASDTVGSTNSKVATLTVDPTFTRITTGPVVDPTPDQWFSAWGDYDNDGSIDLFVANAGWSGGRDFNSLFHNNGDGTFTKMTTNDVGPIVGDFGGWAGVGWADYDNDGFLDMMVGSGITNQPAALYRNMGNGTFDRVTDAGPIVSDYNWCTCWGDYDQDGFVDVFSPNSYKPLVKNNLYQNQGQGRFARITQGPLVTVQYEVLEGAGWCDLDGDGDLDMVLADHVEGPEVFRNDGGGTFVEVTSGVLPTTSGLAVGPAFADYDNDGRLDVFIPMYNATSYLFHNDGNWQFTRTLLGPGDQTLLGAWGDYDNDGDLDLFICRGQSTAVANLMYRNDGNGTFTRVTTGSPAVDVGRCATCIWGDYDNDGFLDLFVARRAGEQKLLYHNNGNTNHWLLVKLEGRASNRAAIGAKVRAQATIFGNVVTQMREIPGGNRAQNDLRAHFGLGDATNVNLLRIEWPSGLVQEFTDVAAGQILTITEHQAGVPTAPSLTAAKTASGPVNLTLTGQTNLLYAFEASTNLAQWTKIAVRTNLTGTVEVTDSAATNYRQRFYRALAP